MMPATIWKHPEVATNIKEREQTEIARECRGAPVGSEQYRAVGQKLFWVETITRVRVSARRNR